MMIANATSKNQKVLSSRTKMRASRAFRTANDARTVVGTWGTPRSFSTSRSNGSSIPPPILLHTEELLGNTTTSDGSKKDSDDGRGGNIADPYSIVFLHGLLGNGRNLKTFARNVVKKQQQKEQILESMSSSSMSSSSLLLHHEKHYHCQSGILVDLPGHGKSRLSVDDKNGIPYSFERCVTDVLHSTTVTSRPSGVVPKILVGHSWGGRLTLEYTARQVQQRQQQQSQSDQLRTDYNNDDDENDQNSILHSAWLLDTVPGVANDSVNRVLDAVDQIEEQSSHGGVLDKKQLVETLTDRFKIDVATSQWLASSYRLPDETGKDNVDFGFDLHVVKDIFPEFGTQDFMGMVYEILVNGTTQLHVVRGGKNTAWTVPVLNDLQKLQKDFPTKFGLHVLPKAGHWVHIDDQKGLVDLF